MLRVVIECIGLKDKKKQHKYIKAEPYAEAVKDKIERRREIYSECHSLVNTTFDSFFIFSNELAPYELHHCIRSTASTAQ